MKDFAIIEVGSNNTKVHVYHGRKVIYQNTVTIEFKKNYHIHQDIVKEDFQKLKGIILTTKKYTDSIFLFGCSIFRLLSSKKLEQLNTELEKELGVTIEVVSQNDEALLTALGCYGTNDYRKTMCIFIGGGGSIELIFVKNKKVIDQYFYDFGVVDITKKFESLKDDIPSCTFSEVTSYVADLIGVIKKRAEVLVLAGGDHIYWYRNARFKMEKNILYKDSKQKYMISHDLNDQYDQKTMLTSLNKIRNRSDNPLWFDGSRAMKMVTNVISHKIHAQYIIPTSINMEDGLYEKIIKDM